MDPVQQPLEPINPDGSENPEIPAAPEPQSTPEMDQTEDTVQPPREVTVSIPAAETQTESSVQTDRPAATESPEETTPGETTPANTITDPNVQTSVIENTSAPQEDEPAPWAGVEEDTSVPDEEELKKIESSDGDYSAREYPYWEKSFFNEVEDPEYRPAEKARLTWQIKGVRGTKENPNRAKIMRSPPAYVGGYWWTIKFFPRGNGSQSLSVYVECSKEMPTVDEKLPETLFEVRNGAPTDDLQETAPRMSLQIPVLQNTQEWYENYKKCYSYVGANTNATDASADGSKKVWRVSAQIGVIMYNPNEPRTGWMQSSCHQFNPHNLDWGWTYFHGPWDEIHLRQKGQRQALLRNDTLAFDAYIRVFDDPTLSLWWHPSDSEPVWDSLAVTGYRPMGDSVINHSAEVAGLASWIYLAPFREIIQSVDVDEHRRNCNVKPRPLCEALQEFLWRLRHQKPESQCVDTDKVTSTLRNLHEYSSDVTEFWERVRRTLEIELEGTDAGEKFARLFNGSPAVVTDPQGSNVVHTLPTTQLIPSIRIPVDKEKTIQTALGRYFEAQSGRWSLPPVLHIELNRQRFDQSSRQWKLLYNRVDLDETLDLAPYVVSGQTGDYDLYGFIIHRGRRTSGKFFSILRPGGPGSKWVAIDDGSHNRVECLTRKAALESHVGLDASKLKDANDKTGHDFAVAVLYVRHDVVQQYLPGKLEPWDVAEPLRSYFETGSYKIAGTDSGSASDKSIQVEVYGLPTVDADLSSLFDTYDLMAYAKRSNNVMYINLPKDITVAELRKKIAFCKSSEKEQIASQRVKIWKIGHTKKQLGAGLLFDRQDVLTEALSEDNVTVRLWVHVLSEEAAKSFAIPDLTAVKTLEEKPEGNVEVRDAQDSDEERSSAEGSRSAASNSTQPPSQQNNASSRRPEGSESSGGNATADTTSSEDNARPDTSETDTEPMDVDHNSNSATPQPTAAADPEQSAQNATQDASMDTATNSQVENDASNVNRSTETSAEATGPASPLPHLYYFVQSFDTDTQSLKFAGGFVSALADNVKSTIRKNMGWADNKDFLIWSRIDNTSVVTVSSTETFSMSVGDGHCYIVGDRLNKEQRARLGSNGLFTNPDRLVQYIWASSRRHPTRAFTGTKTVDATFNGDYYSGEFSKGYYHGKGTHISDTGTVYDGDFILGQRHGQGKMEYPSGDTYEGDWVEDQRHGQGTFIESKTGNKYVGGYKDGKRHGKGISYWEVADEEMDLCQICYGEEQNALFYDCGHVCACVACANEVDICPICRKNVLKVVKIYKM